MFTLKWLKFSMNIEKWWFWKIWKCIWKVCKRFSQHVKRSEWSSETLDQQKLCCPRTVLKRVKRVSVTESLQDVDVINKMTCTWQYRNITVNTVMCFSYLAKHFLILHHSFSVTVERRMIEWMNYILLICPIIVSLHNKHIDYVSQYIKFSVEV